MAASHPVAVFLLRQLDCILEKKTWWQTLPFSFHQEWNLLLRLPGQPVLQELSKQSSPIYVRKKTFFARSLCVGMLLKEIGVGPGIKAYSQDFESACLMAFGHLTSYGKNEMYLLVELENIQILKPPSVQS